MKLSLRYLSFIALLLIFPVALAAQDNFIIKGTVRDSLNNEALIGATLQLLSTSTGIVTDAGGAYSLRLKKGPCRILVSYVGYHPKEISFDIKKDSVLEIFLAPALIQAKEVVITAKNPVSNTESSRTGIVELSQKDIVRLPSLMGESDLIRALHYSPGVQNASDGNSGFYVRGGNVDQNLILLDNAVVYNPSHILGFFSIFNSDLISNATLIKSGIPSVYGGRISSVLTVKTTDGNFEKHQITANIGLLYSKATLQGPLIKNRISYVISLRKSYINEVLKPILNALMPDDSVGTFSGSRFGMVDMNLKISSKINNRNRLSLTMYKGRDNFSLDRKDLKYTTDIDWGNTLIALNWNRIISDSTYLLNSLNYSKYDFDFSSRQFIMAEKLYSAIKNWNYKLEYSTINRHLGTLKTGLEAKYYTFVPNRFELKINQVALDYSSYQNLMASEIAAFASFEKDVTTKIRINAGLRFNNYRQLGPYNDTRRTSDNSIKDTLHYRKLETIETYSNIEPRFSIRFQTSDVASLKASYTRNYQYIHVASASSVTMPSDIWVPSTAYVKPQYGDQITLGYYRNFESNTFTSSLEMFYKKLSNQVEMLYGLGASLQDVSFEKGLAAGKGYATGIEFYLQKITGLLTGSVGYSLSYTERQFDKINEGKPFPAKYDRRHEIYLAAVYKLNKRWDFSAAFIYATGNAMTVPVQLYVFDSNINTEYSKTNAYRMPAYHRLDLSATCNLKSRGRFSSSLNFSVFNVYNRANPFLIFFDIQGDIINEHRLSISAKQISIFPIMPSVSWNLKF